MPRGESRGHGPPNGNVSYSKQLCLETYHMKSSVLDYAPQSPALDAPVSPCSGTHAPTCMSANNCTLAKDRQLVSFLKFPFRFTRMSPGRFEHLLSLVGPLIAKEPCRSRNTVSEAERLMLTLRFLATGDSQQSCSFAFRLGKATVSKIIRETCGAIWTALSKTYVKFPTTPEEWKCIAKEFYNEWNFPNCLGAIDGKHVMIECPSYGGSAYYNYKNFHSIVLLAVCDAKYCFSFVDIGAYGGTNDASILSSSALGKSFENNTLSIPEPCLHGDQTLSFVLLGDDIFPLKPWLIKPFPGKGLDEREKVYNYRLSRARRTIENAFGILSAKWRIFRRPIRANVDLVDKITQATVCLHNYLRLTDNSGYMPSGFVDCEDSSGNILPGNWREEVADNDAFRDVQRIGGNRYTYDAGNIRSAFRDHFNSEQGEAECPWQLRHVRNCGHVHTS